MPYTDSISENVSGNKETIRRSIKCACLYCEKTFSSSRVDDWWEEGDGSETAVCPLCGIDEVVGDAGFPSDETFVKDITNPLNILLVLMHAKIEADPPAYSGDLFIARYKRREAYLLKFLTAKQFKAQKKDLPDGACLFLMEDGCFAVGFEYETLEDASAAAKEEYHINEDKWVHDDDPNRLLNVSHDECE